VLTQPGKGHQQEKAGIIVHWEEGNIEGREAESGDREIQREKRRRLA
jgi:hypothetical protein